MITWLRTRGVCLLALACLVLAPAHLARADAEETGSAQEPADYRATVNDAIREYNLRNFAEARSLFARAHAYFPNARTLRGLGASEFELRNYGESVRYLEQALSSKVRPLDDALRVRTERLLARARGFVARLRLQVSPASSVTIVDGVPMRDAREILLEVGDHVIEFHADGYVPERRKLRVDGGEEKLLHVALTVRLNVRAREATPPTRRRLYKSPWLWTGVVAVVAGTATALAVSLQGRDERTLPVSGGSTGQVLP